MDSIVSNELPTITDWIQAIGACIAAIGLVVTLILQWIATRAQVKATNDQIKVNKAQLAVSKLEYKRYLQEIQPVFEFSWKYKENEVEQAFRFRCTGNPAFDITVKNGNPETIKFTWESNPADLNIESDRVKLFSFIKAGVTKDELYGLNVQLKINFKDKLGNEYEQTFIQYGHNPQLDSTIPQLINPSRTLAAISS